MREDDLKVQEIARATKMLYMKGGIEHNTRVEEGGFSMDFQYQTPDEMAYIEVVEVGKPNKRGHLYMDNELDFDLIKKDFPMFFD